ncbi:MAG: shikimate kinase [Nitrososphaeria archaeon]|nr:shikimate kinase [Nitrososphaeria archaeon]
MKVRATVHGAVSILNAIPAGIGGAIGIDLYTIVEAERIEEKKLEVEIKVEDEEVGDTSLVEKAVDRVLNLSKVRDLGISLKIFSNIPVARGLKSSSAVADAVVLSVSKLLGVDLSLLEAVNLAVESSIDAGVTITGAYDDALTCMIGGVNITDNIKREILAHWEIEERFTILISIPEKKIYTKMVDVTALKNVKELSQRIAELALNGWIWDAMILNGILIASALDLDYRPAMIALKKKAIASGISGKGPAIVVVTSPEYERELARELENYGKVIKTKPNNMLANVEVIE